MPFAFKCQLCGEQYQNPPILLPKSRLYPRKNSPGFYDVDNIRACIYCVIHNLSTIKEKFNHGEFLPIQTWSSDFKVVDAIYETNEGDKNSREVFPNAHFF